MPEPIHKLLSNTWAVVALIIAALACMTTLVVTDAITWNEGKAAVIAIVTTAAAVWFRGTKP